jgi:Ran GTPase-activating protein (RanGAP) involved in mRNA processing and transport
VGKWLKNNFSMKEIDLSHNNIGPEGGKELFEAITQNQCLLTLKINRNKFAERTDIISSFLKNNHFINSIDVSHSFFSDCSPFVELLSHNFSLLFFKVDHSKGDASCDSFAPIFHENLMYFSFFFLFLFYF